ncbi:MAG: HDOD domain-containing protein [Patescibacteria group bacterium]|nr:HDOD domain-containing protein [Patescibacteria group bacterium]
MNNEIENKTDALQMLDRIEKNVLGRETFGLNPKAMEILSNEEKATCEDFEELKNLISPEIVGRIASTASSLYSGNLGMGKISSFQSVVMRLGMRNVKGLIIALPLFSQNKDKKTKELEARCLAVSKMAKLIAKRSGLADEIVSKLETVGIFSEIGNVIFRLYELKTKKELLYDFIERYHRFMAMRLLDKFGLADFKEIAFSEVYSFETPSGYLHAAKLIVEESFKKEGRLVVESAMPEFDDISYAYAPGLELKNAFENLGLREYLEIIVRLTPQQIRARERAAKKQEVIAK